MVVSGHFSVDSLEKHIIIIYVANIRMPIPSNEGNPGLQPAGLLHVTIIAMNCNIHGIIDTVTNKQAHSIGVHTVKQ